jgi:DNA mismatch repair protein MutS
MAFVLDYFKSQKEYIKLYGEHTVLIIQKGIFYEIYEYDSSYCLNATEKEKIGYAVDISYILNTDLTQCDKNKPYTKENPHMTGFPLISYEKNKIKLLANNYSIVRIDQAKTSGSAVERFVAEICSPTLDIDVAANNEKMSNIVSLYIENNTAIGKPGGKTGNEYEINFDLFLLTVGVAVVDILTGKNTVSEFYSKEGDEIFAIQELFRFILNNYPNELIININDIPKEYEDKYVKYLEKNLQLARFSRVSIIINKIPDDYKKLPYQEQFLNKIFSPPAVTTGGSKSKMSAAGKKIHVNNLNNKKSPNIKIDKSPLIQTTKNSIISDLNLENIVYGRIAYLILLQFCYNYNQDIITKIDKPNTKWLDENKYCILTHNAILQLDLINYDKKRNDKISSLMSIVNKTVTKMGSKMLLNLFQSPLYNASEIEEYYNLVDAVSKEYQKELIWMTLDKKLKEFGDIELLQRKLTIGNISPKELALLYMNYLKFLDLYIYISKLNNKHINKLLDIDSTQFNNFISIYNDFIDFEALECCNLSDVFYNGDDRSGGTVGTVEFTKNPFPTSMLDESKLLVEKEEMLNNIVDHLNEFLNKTRGNKIVFKNEKSTRGAKKKESSVIALTTTKAKSKLLLNSDYDVDLCGELRTTSLSSTDDIITSDVIEELTNEIEEIKVEMKKQLYIIFKNVIDDVKNKYNFHKPIVKLVSKIDVIHCYAKIAYQNNYYRPIIHTYKKDDKNKSFLIMKNLRHPIIEKLIDNKYITNDVSIGYTSNGGGGTDRNIDTIMNGVDGILLYGVNQTGKSSLAKSIALNIIMAQAGCFTACNLEYKPYSKIITRLSGNDNIFADQSSFAVEMTELRTILRQSDENTLIIGDELARGTESDSATAITVSTILSLLKNKSSFIFATHMHHLTNMKQIKELNNLRICHLSVLYDDTRVDKYEQKLIYDRKLKEGAGSSIYGIMVARSLNLPIDFLNKAQEVLQDMDNRKDLLNINKSRYNSKLYIDCCVICGSNKQLHTHHIIEQKNADEKGYIDNMDKNKKDNLIILCEECHIRIHKQ